MLVELGPCVQICCLNGVEQELGHSHTIHVDQVRLEESLWSTKALTSDLYSTTIRKLYAIGRGMGAQVATQSSGGLQECTTYTNKPVHLSY